VAEVPDNTVLRKIFDPTVEETGEWTNSHNVELHDFYSLSNNIRVMKSGRVRRVVKENVWAIQ
jgi:hypothetical protein